MPRKLATTSGDTDRADLLFAESKALEEAEDGINLVGAGQQE